MTEKSVQPAWCLTLPLQQQSVLLLGNFNGWVSYRKLIPHEFDILGARA